MEVPETSEIPKIPKISVHNEEVFRTTSLNLY
jgi:hypothetical protein